MSYPTSIWDGDTPNRDRDLAQKKSPNWQDWNVLTAELIATQTELDSVKDGSSEVSGIIVDDTGTVLVGEFTTGAATTSALNFSIDLDIYEDGQLDIVQAHGATSEDLTSAYSAKVGRFRHVINTEANSVAHETYGAVGQVVVRNTTLTHLHSGVMGTFESHTEAVVCASSYDVGHAAVIGRIGLGTGITTATTPVAGVLAFNNNTGAVTGSIYAFAAASQGADTWDSLLFASKCDSVLAVKSATDYEAGVKAVAGTAPSGTVTHFLKVLINGSPAYIPAYTADTAS